MVGYFKKNKSWFSYEMTEAEAKEAGKKKRKLALALQKQEEEEQEKYANEHRCGYCPTCLMLKPMTNICPNCG